MRFIRTLRVRTLMIVVAACALGLAAWERWGPAGRWRRSVQIASGIEAWNAAVGPAWGKTPGISADWALAELIAMLQDRDSWKRLFAASALAEYDIGNELTVPALMAAARDRDPRVRIAAMNALYGKTQLDPEVRDRILPPLVRDLGDYRPQIRMTAANHLVRHGRVEGVIPVLVELLRYQDTQRGTLWILRELGPAAASARPAVLHLLEQKPLADPDRWRQRPTPDERIDVASTLLRLGEVEVGRSILEQYSKDQDEVLRTWAREELETYEQEASIPRFLFPGDPRPEDVGEPLNQAASPSSR